jgi:DNA-binding transcriptional LysR family regulator
VRIEAITSFAQLVRSGSYPAASEALFLSPTTIHGHIKGLEQELNATLVVFTGRKLELSRAGSRFFVFAERMLEERAKMERDIQGLSRPDVARLRVSSLHGPSIHLLPPVVRAFRELHPRVTVSVAANGVGGCQAALASGQAEVAILNDLHTNEISGDFATTLLFDDTIEMIIRADYYEAPDEKLLERYPLALQPNTSAYRHYVEHWGRRRNLALNTAFEHTSFDGLLSFALGGACVAMVGGYVPRFSPHASSIRVLKLPDFSLPRSVIAVHAVRPDSLTAEFIEFFRNYFSANVAGFHTNNTNAEDANL